MTVRDVPFGHVFTLDACGCVLLRGLGPFSYYTYDGEWIEDFQVSLVRSGWAINHSTHDQVDDDALIEYDAFSQALLESFE